MARISIFGDFKADEVSRLSLSGNLQYLLNTSDINVVNFEAPIYGMSKPIRKSGPNISQSADSPEWLELRGFNVVSMANNHTMDYGEEGMDDTRKAFKKATVIGCGIWEEAYSPTVVTTADGLRIGILACTHCEFGTLTDKTVYNQKGTAWAGAADIERAIQQNEGGKSCDFLIIIAHCGIEYMEQPLPEWRERYKRWIELGADAVIASHPHVPQGWEMYRGKPICYSLGNFCFQKGKKIPMNWWNSLVCVLEFDAQRLVEMAIRPITFDTESQYIFDRTAEDYMQYLERINKTLHDEDAYMAYINEQVKHLLPFYMNQFSRGGLIKNVISVGTLKGLAEGLMGRGFFRKEHALNNIQCESHRWAILRGLKI